MSRFGTWRTTEARKHNAQPGQYLANRQARDLCQTGIAFNSGHAQQSHRIALQRARHLDG